MCIRDRYWKAPIVLVGLGTSIYFIRENNSQYQRYKDAYIALTDNDPSTVDEFNGQFGSQTVLNVADTYRRWRDLSYIACGLVYVLNIVDDLVYYDGRYYGDWSIFDQPDEEQRSRLIPF